MATDEYAVLTKLINAQHLLDRRPASYVLKVLSTAALLATSITALFLLGDSWLQLLNAVFLAFAFGQIAFLSHDAGHREIFTQPWANNLMGYFTGNLLLGMSYSWWVQSHNRHHSNPNSDLDPDIDVPLLAFSEEQARGKTGFNRFVVKHQHALFFPVLCLAGVNLRRHSILALFNRSAERPVLEGTLLFAHFALLLGALLATMDVLHALLFLIINQLLFGLYIGSVFAPNHKGMLMLKSEQMAFLRRQVLTARNVRAHPLTDYWYGGLNYQIEHHLFPTMPRLNLRTAQHIVRKFCKVRSIPYRETSVLQSYREILDHLRTVSASLRTTA